MADVILNVTVPDAWVTKVLDAFNNITDEQIIIYIYNPLSTPERDLNKKWKFTIQSKQSSENNKEFGERVLRELGKAVVNMVDIFEDKLRYEAEVDALSLPISDVPTDILT